MSDIFPAATVVLMRDVLTHQNSSEISHLEVLMLKRSKEIAFGGGSWVFPGGRIDPGDYTDESNNVVQAAYNAAVRETKEEAGLALVTDDLMYISHWTAPPETLKRFATWFFVAEIEHDSRIMIDGGEIVDYQWFQPQEAIDAFRNKQINMMPPTYVTLIELSQCVSIAQAMAMYKRRPVLEFNPKVATANNEVCMLYPGDAGYASGDLSQNGGSRHRLWLLDDDWVYEKTF